MFAVRCPFAGSAVFCVCLLLAGLGISGCATAPRQDFATLFPMLATAGEALDALQPPKIEQLQDDMVIYSWDGRKETLIPAHAAFVRRRWPSWRTGFFEYDEVWFPDRIHVDHCSAQLITDPHGLVVYRNWRGNACESFVRYFPAWYDRENPGARRTAPSSPAPAERSGP